VTTSARRFVTVDRFFLRAGRDLGLRPRYPPDLRHSVLQQFERPRDNVDSVPSGERTAAALRVRLDRLAGTGHVSMLARPRAVASAVLRFTRR
jgi:hypothetical protein